VRSVKGKIINLLVVAKYALTEVRRLLPGGQSTPSPAACPPRARRRRSRARLAEASPAGGYYEGPTSDGST